MDNANATTRRQTLAQTIAQADPDDLDLWREVLYERQCLIDACPSDQEAAELFRLGERIETKLRISRAKLASRSAECYQTGFLLRAFAGDLAPRPQTGDSVDVTA
jgi:hypothetical protein